MRVLGVRLGGMVVSQNKGRPFVDPKILWSFILGIPNKVPLILGNPHMSSILFGDAMVPNIE